MNHPEVLIKYQETLEGTLGAISAHLVCTSKNSSIVIRDCSKKLDKLSVELRQALLEFDKQLGVHNEQSN